MAEENTIQKLDRRFSALDVLLLLCCIGGALFMTARAFISADLSSEARILANMIGMMRGNLSYALSYSAADIGNALWLIPLLSLYEKLVPDMEGVVLFTRICFLLFRYLFILIIYCVVRKSFGRTNALLFAACLIPLNDHVINFTRETVPALLMCLTASLAFSATEQQGKHAGIALLAAGFFGVLCMLSNYLYVFAVLALFIVIIVRSDKKKRLANVLWFLIGTVVPILAGIVVLFMIPVLNEKLGMLFSIGIRSVKGLLFGHERIVQLISLLNLKMFLPAVLFFVLFGFCLQLVYAFYSIPPGKTYTKEQQGPLFLTSMGLTIAGFLLYLLFTDNSPKKIYYVGAIAFVFLVLAMLSGYMKKYPPVLYFGLCPLIYVVFDIGFGHADSYISCFWAAIPILFVLILLLRESKNKAAKVIGLVCAALFVLFQLHTVLYNTNEEVGPGLLTSRTESGVYKGIYTTASRAEDLPDTERFINELVSDNDTVAFRDRVPSAYLMLHHGTMCDLESSYPVENEDPSELYGYYQRCGKIPTLIVYLYGDEDVPFFMVDDYRFNDFLAACYFESTDTELNDTFQRVTVFRYSGGFDGNFSFPKRIKDTLPEEG